MFNDTFTKDLSRRGFVFAAAGCALGALTACTNPATPDNGSAGSAAGSGADGSGALRVGCEVAFAPYEWMTETASDTTLPVEGGGYADGYDVAWAKLIGEKLGRDVVFVNLAFDGLIDALNQGRVDILISGLADTEERRQSIAFSKTYKRDGYGLMVKKGSEYENATELADFAGASVLGQKASPLDECIDQIPDVNHLTPVKSVPDMLSALDQGTCDAITCALENTPGYLASYPDFIVIDPQNPRLDPGFDGTCVGVRLEDVELLEQINEVIDSVSQEENDAMWEAAVERQPV